MTSALTAIFMTMLGKLIGYELVSRVLVNFLELWGASTKTHFDDRVFNQMAKSLGVDSAVLKKLVEEADKAGAI
jgi:hypothetical protein